MENLIWNTITESAKKRFDYDKFEKPFIDTDRTIAENILFNIIVEYANETNSEIITAKIFNDLLISGFNTDRNEFEIFIDSLKTILKVEIFTVRIANDMMQKGIDEVEVLKNINQLLK